MAHRGKTYKLQFRRDLTLNRFQTQGACECYDIECLCLGITTPGIVFNYTARAVNLDRSSNNDRMWTSDYFIAGTRRWRFRTTGIEFWKFPQNFFRWEIEDEIAGLIYRITRNNGEVDPQYGGWGLRDQGSSDFHKPPFPSERVACIWNARIQFYDTYNP